MRDIPLSSDLSRRLESLIRFGAISAVDHATARVRVSSGGIETDWLPWCERRAGTTRDWDPPTVGEQCVLFSPSGDPGNGVALTGLFADHSPAPSRSPDECTRVYPDGAKITYNHAASHLDVSGIRTFRIEASGSGLVDCPEVTFTGNVTIEGALTVQDLLTYRNGLAGYGGDKGNGNRVTGDFIHDEGVLSSHGVVLHTHDHEEGVGSPR